MKRKGFTLIELLSVIIILAVIALIATPQVLDVINDAKDSSRTSSISGYADAVKLKATTDYFDNGGSYVDCFDLNDLNLNNNSVVCQEAYYLSDNRVLLGNCTVNDEGNYWYENGNVTNVRPDNFDVLKASGLASNSCHQSNASTQESCFDFDSSTGTIKKYNFEDPSCSTDVVIPDSINGVTIEHIGQGAFVDVDNLECFDSSHNVVIKDKNYNHTSSDGYVLCGFALGKNLTLDAGTNLITSVSLPPHLKTIALGAFQSQLLTNVTLPDSVTSIGDLAFGKNSLMTSAAIGNGLTTIGQYAFAMNALPSLTLGNSVTTIGQYAFAMNKLSNLTLDNSLVTIDSYSFIYNQIKNVCIPNSVTKIGSMAFYSNYIEQGDAIINNIEGNVTVAVDTFMGNGTNKSQNITPIYSSDVCSGVINEKPTIAFSSTGTFTGSGWASSEFYITATATPDTTTSISNILWCSGTSNCTPTILVNSSSASALVSTDSGNNIMCAKATDAAGNSSATICSRAYKLDKLAPTLTANILSTTIYYKNDNYIMNYFTVGYTGVAYMASTSCADTSNGNSVVTTTSSLLPGTHNITCTATKANGLSASASIVVNVLINNTYGGTGEDMANSIVQTSDGGYIIAGQTGSTSGDVSDGNNGNLDAWIIKVSSSGVKQWDKTYGGSSYDYAQSIVQTSDGGYIIAGHTRSNNGDVSDGNNGRYDVWVIKLNSSGVKVWDKTFGGSGDDFAQSIVQTSDSGYILAGYTNSMAGDVSDGNNGSSDVWVIKLDSTGSKQWDKTFGGSNADGAYSIEKTNDGGYIVAGYSASNDGDITSGNVGNSDILVLKLTASGTKAWDKTYGWSYDEKAVSIIQTSDGGYALAGYRDSQLNYNQKDLVIKLSSSGTQEWVKSCAVGLGDSILQGIIQTTDGGYIVIGTKGLDNYATHNAWAIKLSSSGTLDWDKTYGGQDRDSFSSIAKTSDGGYILAGYSISHDGDIGDGNNGDYDVWIIKF